MLNDFLTMFAELFKDEEIFKHKTIVLATKYCIQDNEFVHKLSVVPLTSESNLIQSVPLKSHL